MTFFALVWRGLKAHLALSVAIGIGYWIQILRLDINGEIEIALAQVLLSTAVIVFAAPFFAYLIGMNQGASTARVSDAGLAGALTGVIGFVALLCIPLLLAVAAYSIAYEPPADADSNSDGGVSSADEELTTNVALTADSLTDSMAEMIWLGLPTGFAGWFAASMGSRQKRKQLIEQRSDEQSQTLAAQAHENAALSAAAASPQPAIQNPTPWVYAVGLVDAAGYEWIEHNGQTWYRIANSGTEWALYAV